MKKTSALAVFALLAATGLASSDEFSADNGFGDHSPAPQVLTENYGYGRMIDRTPTGATAQTGGIMNSVNDEVLARSRFGDGSPKPQVLTESRRFDYRATGAVGAQADRSANRIPVWLPFQ